jgi:hypothetical protein
MASRPGNYPDFDIANLDYQGYRYRPEVSRSAGATYYHHWVYHPCGYHELIRFAAGFHLTAKQFRLLVDLDLPEPSEFSVGLKPSDIRNGMIFTPDVLARIDMYREDNGVYDIDVMLVMMKLSDYSVWTPA